MRVSSSLVTGSITVVVEISAGASGDSCVFDTGSRGGENWELVGSLAVAGSD